MTVCEWCKGRVGGWIGEGMQNIMDTRKDKVIGIGQGHGDLGWEPR